MVIAQDGTIVVESKEDLRNLLNSDHQGIVFSVTAEDMVNEGGDELPFPEIPSLEEDDLSEVLGEEDDE